MTSISKLLDLYLNRNHIDPSKGLGTDLFLAASCLVPVVNVDLLVYNTQGQFLLTWRDDNHCGTGWHIPGGCIRFKETFEERIRKVAKCELGLSDFTFDKVPLNVFEIIDNDRREIDYQNERAHFIALAYKCYAPDSYVIDNGGKKEGDVGFIRWFDRLPRDFLKIQSCYKEILK